MEVFTAIEDNMALVRYPKGVLKQVQMYRRGGHVYLPHSGGYIEVRAKQTDGTFTTSHPDVKLLEHDTVDNRIITEKYLGQDNMRWRK